MGNDYPRLLSRPLKVRWAGWESDTLRLQQSGWQISAQQDIYRDAMRIALQHSDWGTQGMSECITGLDYMQNAQAIHDGWREIQFGLRFGKTLAIHESPQMVPFTAIDAIPQLCERKITRLEDYAHFAVPLVRTQEIVLPDELSVDELLSRILEKQQGAKRSYFQEQIAREGLRPMNQKFHAQIITLADRRAA